MTTDRDALREALQVLEDFTYPQGYSATEAETHAEKALQVIRAALAAEPPALDVERLREAMRPRQIDPDVMAAYDPSAEEVAAEYARLASEEQR